VGDILGRSKDGFQPVNTDEREGMLGDDSDSEVKQSSLYMCSGSVTVLKWIRILGSVHWITDPDLDLDPDPALFFNGFQGAKKKNSHNFLACFLLRVTFIIIRKSQHS
jgi:hypothetical protein